MIPADTLSRLLRRDKEYAEGGELAQLDSQGENVPADGWEEGNLPLKRPPIAHITLPEVWEAQNNDECLKIIREVLKGNISYSCSQECNLSRIHMSY